MTKILEDKELLLRDLCARLPYGVKLCVKDGEFDSFMYPYLMTAISKFGPDSLCKAYNPIFTPLGCPKIEDVKPYLRPVSSMTEEEKLEYFDLNGDTVKTSILLYDWLSSHHFDYRGLIEKGLALEAPDGMY